MSFKFNGAHASVLLSLCLGCNVAGAIAQTPAPAAADSASLAPTTAPTPLPTSGEGTSASPVETIASAAATPVGEPCCTLSDGSPVQLEVVGPISSKTALRGQTFALRLAQPLSTAEGVLLPAGTEGVGEVIHAERSREVDQDVPVLTWSEIRGTESN